VPRVSRVLECLELGVPRVFIGLSVYRFIGLSVYRFIGLSVYLLSVENFKCLKL
jgi:hypothetical protein